MRQKENGKNVRFPLELNEKPNKGGRIATAFVRLFKFPMNKNYFFQAAILLSQAPSQIYRQTILGYFHHSKRHAYKKPDDLQSIAKLIRFLI